SAGGTAGIPPGRSSRRGSRSTMYASTARQDEPCFPWPFKIRTIARMVFQLRVVAGTPNSLSSWPKIGRASCRERVEISVGGGAVKKKRERSARQDRAEVDAASWPT